MDEPILMPINKKFLAHFEALMDDKQKTIIGVKIRANQVRQYTEGLIDLFLKDKIMPNLKQNEDYDKISSSKKIKYIEKYNKNIATTIRRIFEIGGKGSHFKGHVSEKELNEIIKLSTHFIEDIFVEYFLSPSHKFGTEEILTIFSMLPLRHRIYILENVYAKDKNLDVVKKLSLAYIKNGEDEKFNSLITEALEEKIINSVEYAELCKKCLALKEKLPEVQMLNSKYSSDTKHVIGKIAPSVPDLLVIGFPSSRDVFDMLKAADLFKRWFKENEGKYPEFVNLFYCLMARDDREYTS